MPTIIDPFGSGATIAELTDTINNFNIVPKPLRALGLFREVPIRSTTVVVGEWAGTLRVIPASTRGGPRAVSSSVTGKLRSFVVPHFPKDDVVLPEEVQDRASNFQTPDVNQRVLEEKLRRLRKEHDLTREYLEINALFGTVKDHAGNTIYNYFTEFGVSQITVDFDLGTATTDVKAKVREVLRNLEDEVKGLSFNSVTAFVSPEFFDKLTNHQSVKEAYLNWQAAEALRTDIRRGFPFGGIRFVEYRGTFSLPDGTSTRMVPANDGVAFPDDADGLFETYFAPPNVIEAVNLPGVPIYARTIKRLDGSGWDIKTESNALPLVKQPRACIKLTTST